ncbi:hypothetical protein [Siminovitchia fordii]|uniref:Uncharacterized protein n=1 Tax=Siminovitchia fordii TaxID=254759 RepID=A0ABQ4K3L0_9BACI|nr:hypothetical protein [Siminovitchia fordii]GIN19727.1 hypothetical protein J1TS3_08610 [Siminovitchia fordii]
MLKILLGFFKGRIGFDANRHEDLFYELTEEEYDYEYMYYMH